MIDVQGHRGCRGLLPENSLPAFKKAIELGVHTLELDVAVTNDNQVIVSHEPFMSRTICKMPTGKPILEHDDMQFNLYQMSHDSIKQFDCGTKTHPRFPDQQLQSVYKPLLSEVFEMAEALNPDIKYNIELKAKPKYDDIYTPKPEVFVNLVLEELKQYKIGKRCNLQSFDLRILEEIKKQDPKMKVALLVDEDENIDLKFLKLSYTPEIISPYFELLDNSIIEQYQEKGIQIIPWTVNDIDDMKRMIDFSVDGIITDYPDLLISLIKS
ncbi:glycerophosphodiester phosphodiesterase family protein [Ichthyenterobacterium sp. W332]|uniref:Glycerophosphodiester phosphodiesterase family protein n=1 Tax=Microcosmobacter mediterraneus TaxID=3075607 RepID=A0ABU2YK69_9FLAO|nr:glycerophosphodiester phosphodiesterase family protein [Ichthyenterobacterium sp. W332]MDT0558281.1 glycerophosphodiester phosphodiesterase family protein [Ichthyenterobacterium sp. W332]